MQKMGGGDYNVSRNEDIRLFVGKWVEKQTLVPGWSLTAFHFSILEIETELIR